MGLPGSQSPMNFSFIMFHNSQWHGAHGERAQRKVNAQCRWGLDSSATSAGVKRAPMRRDAVRSVLGTMVTATTCDK